MRGSIQTRHFRRATLGPYRSRGVGLSAESLLEGQNRALELIATDAPLHDILEFLTKLIEAHSLGSAARFCSWSMGVCGAAQRRAFLLLIATPSKASR